MPSRCHTRLFCALILSFALPLGHDARAGETITLGADDSSYTDSTNYLTPAVSDLIKDGAGIISLTGTNTYSGGTTINAGTLAAGTSNAFGTGSMTINNTGTLDLDGTNVSVGALSGSTGATITNTGTADATLTANSDTNYTFAGTIQDGPTNSTALTKDGGGTLTLSGNNTFSGGVTMKASQLNLKSANALGTGPLTIAGLSVIVNASGSPLTLAGNNAINLQNNVFFDGGAGLNLGTGAVTLSGDRIIRLMYNVTMGGVIGGAGHLTINGGSVGVFGGKLILSNDNTYTGGTFLDQGLLQIGDGGTKGSIIGNIALGGNDAFVPVLSFNRSDDFTFSGAISGRGTVQQDGTGKLTLSGVNTQTGNTVVNSGSLIMGNANALPAGGNLVVNSGGTFDVNGNNVTMTGLLSGQGTITNGGAVNTTLTISNASDTFAGKIQDGTHTLALAKNGTGTLTLSGANTYSGGTALSGGTLVLNNASALGMGALMITGSSTIDNTTNQPLTLTTNNPISLGGDLIFKGTRSLNLGTGAVSLSGNPTITVQANELTLGGVISGASPLTVIGPGSASSTMILTGENTYTGGTRISKNVSLVVGSGTKGSILGDVDVQTTGHLVFGRSDDVTFGGVISGAGGVQQAGSGTTTLTGNNIYTDETLVIGGTLRIGNGGTSGSISSTGNLIVRASGQVAFNRSDNITYTGDISGSGTLNQMGPGTLILTGHDFMSQTLISGGTLQVGNGGTTGSISGAITTQGILAINHSDTFALSNNISGTGSIQQNGPGTTNLSGSNSYSGGTSVNAGVLNLNSATALGTSTLHIGAGVTVGTTSTTNLTLTTNNAQTWDGDFTFKTATDMNIGTGAVTLTGNRTVTMAADSGVTVGGVISGDFSLTKSGPGLLRLSGANTYSGGTTIEGGLLGIDSSQALGTGTLVIARPTTILMTSVPVTLSTNNAQSWNADITLVGHSLNLGTGAVLMNATRTLDVQSDGLTVGGGISGVKSSNGLIKNGSGKLVLGGANTFGGTLMINRGIVQLGDGVSNGSLASAMVTNKTVLAFDQVSDSPFDAKIKGTGAVWQNGTNVVTLTQANSYSGGNVINSGTLRQGRKMALGVSADLTVNGAGTLDLNGFDLKVDTLIGTGGGAVTNNGAAFAVLTTTSAVASSFTGAISDGLSALALTKAGKSTFILVGANTYTGPTTIKAGTLQIGNGGTTGSIASASVSNSGTLVINRSNAFTYVGVIAGKGDLLQKGSGTTTLTGANTYTGDTIVNNGTLTVGNLAALGGMKSNLTLNGGTLQTNGLIHQINVGGNLSLDSSATIALTLTPDATSEFVNVGGKVSLLDGGPFVFTLTPDSLTPGHHDFIVLTAKKGFGSLTGDDFEFTSSDPDLEGTFEIIGKDLWFKDGYGDDQGSNVSFGPSGFSGPQPVPEPSTWAMLIFGGAVLVFLKRRPGVTGCPR